jgi:hypothetical protein
MKTRYRLTRRGIRGDTFYCVDTTNGKRTSLRTTNAEAAQQIVEAKNNSERQPVLNLNWGRPNVGLGFQRCEDMCERGFLAFQACAFNHSAISPPEKSLWPSPAHFSIQIASRFGMTCAQIITTGLKMLRKPAKFGEGKPLPITEYQGIQLTHEGEQSFHASARRRTSRGSR